MLHAIRRFFRWLLIGPDELPIVIHLELHVTMGQRGSEDIFVTAAETNRGRKVIVQAIRKAVLQREL